MAEGAVRSGRLDDDDSGSVYSNSFVIGTDSSDVETIEEGIRRTVVAESEIQRKNRVREMYVAMRKLVPTVQGGVSVRSVRGPHGKLLSYDERKVLLRLLPNDKTRSTGKLYTVRKDNSVFESGYDCPFNLAGRFFVVTSDAKFFEISLGADAHDCGHGLCDGAKHIRQGGEDDGIVMLLKRASTEFPNGVLSATGIGGVSAWNAIYHKAVFMVQLARTNLTLPKYRALLGHKFIPKTLFGEVCVFMSKMMGVQDTGFCQYFAHRELFDNVYSGVPGSSAAYKLFHESVVATKFDRLSNYAWALHHLCNMQGMYPHVEIPFEWFIKDIDRLSRNSVSAIKRCVAEYEMGDGRNMVSVVQLYDHQPLKLSAVTESLLQQASLGQEFIVSTVQERFPQFSAVVVDRVVDRVRRIGVVVEIRGVQSNERLSQLFKDAGILPVPVDGRCYLYREALRNGRDPCFYVRGVRYKPD